MGYHLLLFTSAPRYPKCFHGERKIEAECWKRSEILAGGMGTYQWKPTTKLGEMTNRKDGNIYPIYVLRRPQETVWQSLLVAYTTYNHAPPPSFLTEHLFCCGVILPMKTFSEEAEQSRKTERTLSSTMSQSKTLSTWSYLPLSHEVLNPPCFSQLRKAFLWCCRTKAS